MVYKRTFCRVHFNGNTRIQQINDTQKWRWHFIEKIKLYELKISTRMWFDTILLLASLRKSYQKRIIQMDTDRNAVLCFYTCVVPSFRLFIPISLFAPSRCGLGRIREVSRRRLHMWNSSALSSPEWPVSVSQSHGAQRRSVSWRRPSKRIPRPTNPIYALHIARPSLVSNSCARPAPSLFSLCIHDLSSCIIPPFHTNPHHLRHHLSNCQTNWKVYSLRV